MEVKNRVEIKRHEMGVDSYKPRQLIVIVVVVMNADLHAWDFIAIHDNRCWRGNHHTLRIYNWLVA